MNEELYNRTKLAGFSPIHVAEVGVFLPETSNILKFIEDGVPADLIEPDPIIISKLHEYFDSFPNVTIHPFAVYDKNGPIELYRAGASTFVGELPASPALVNDKYSFKAQDMFIAQAKKFDEIDDGTIDILSVDTEGCEWYILKYMKSRPLVMSLETHGKKYVNPYMNDIEKWISENVYETWYKDKSDTVFIKKGHINIPGKENIFKKILSRLIQ